MAERGAYCDLMALAGKLCPSGLLATPGGQPYSLRWLAARLNIPITILRRTVRQIVRLGLAQDTAQGLLLIDYQKRQSDYYRQKPYRNGAQSPAQKEHTPVDYLQGKYGHMVQH